MNIHYIAGVVDSGCSVVIEKGGRPKIDIMRKDIRLLEMIQQQFGGGIVRWSSRGGYRLRIRNHNAYLMARALHPICVTRKTELQILLDLAVISGKRGMAEEREKIRLRLMRSRL